MRSTISTHSKGQSAKPDSYQKGKLFEEFVIQLFNHQIRSYQDFENRRRIPVLIAIGVGGEASNPERLFVTPLRNMEAYIEVYEVDLIAYKRKPTRKFFYDTVQLKLF